MTATMGKGSSTTRDPGPGHVGEDGVLAARHPVRMEAARGAPRRDAAGQTGGHQGEPGERQHGQRPADLLVALVRL